MSPLASPTATNTATKYLAVHEQRHALCDQPSTSPQGIGYGRCSPGPHADLSRPARELALAIDQYKMRHRRRFINYEEMLSIVQALGYSK
jgi:hypothetical protein